MAIVHLRSVLLSSVLALSASVPPTLKFDSAAVEGFVVEAETCFVDGTEDCALHALQTRTAARRASSEGGSATAAEREAYAVAVAGATTDARASSRPRPIPDEFFHSNGTSLYANASAPRTAVMITRSDEFSHSNGTSLYANASAPRAAVAVRGGAAAHSSPGHVSTDPMPCDEIDIMTLAEMSYQVYDLANSPDIGMNDVIHEAGFEANETFQAGYYGWFLPGLWIPSYAVFVREAPCRQAVLAIKGTDLTRNDLEADAYSIVAGMRPRLATNTLGPVVRRWAERGYAVFSTGHSLGGYVGEIMSTTHDLPGAVFCAPGPDSLTNPHNGPFRHGKFRNLNHEHDFLGNVAPGTFTHAQWSIYVETDNGYHHSMRSMIEGIRSKSGWADMTNGNVVSYASPRWYGYLL